MGLGRMLAGLELLTDAASGHAVDHGNPGLAVDPAGRRAYVVGPSLLAELDLATLSVRYHVLAGRQPAAHT